MDRRLLQAATSGDAASMKHLALHDPAVLLGTTPQGNTCLHISCIHGHGGLCMDVVVLNRSLLTAINADGETPLLTSVTSGHVSLASFLLRCCRDQQLTVAILQLDKHGCNALHHAIRSGHRELALELIEAEPALSRVVNKYHESPMFIAVMRNYADICEKLLEIPDSAHGGAFGYNALHAAVRNGNAVIAKKIVETRPWLAKEENVEKSTPMHTAVLWDKIDVLRVLLEYDSSLGYIANTENVPLLVSAAYRDHIGVAQELLKHCPDAPSYNMVDGWTCLHHAVRNGRTEFVEFILRSQQLRKLVNMRTSYGDCALHWAVNKCNPEMVAALLLHPDRDITMLNNKGFTPTWILNGVREHAKTLNWNEISMLMLKAEPEYADVIYNLLQEVKDEVTENSRKNIKTLTQTYTSNTSLVAILIATITFAAAFTLPGGYSSDAGSEGLPIMTRKLAFQAFLIFDTLAMCSSLVVAFVCIIASSSATSPMS
ncbi:hypothetical protein QOZ80_9AG0676970 [Eleusine coracana subsp. coracana]|nr:hypothetical protein QOZ80_9AG0676970 [Eleusine coracana subsp. coracana]